MSGRIRAVSGHQRQPLVGGWELASAAPGAIADPNAESLTALNWMPIEHLGTVAAVLHARGVWSPHAPTRRLDSDDWWYRLRFAAPKAAGVSTVLGFDGLATLANIWLNGEALLSSDNMFVAHTVPIASRLKTDNELVLCFRSVDAALTAKRPRPRWRTPMVEHQQLRWLRTTLLGRTPGWSPPAPPIGPWRPIWLEVRPSPAIDNVRVRSEVIHGKGIVHARVRIAAPERASIEAIKLTIARGSSRQTVEINPTTDPLNTGDPTAVTYTGRLEVPQAELWWPHTHGPPALYEAQLSVTLSSQKEIVADLGHVGFRTVAVDTRNDDFTVRINDTEVFCRGACWMPLDCVSPHGEAAAVDAAVAQIAAAGMNMLRVSGTMVYESDAFLDACDRHGILVWQDFMFANMDYPQDDATFNASVKTEVEQVLSRLDARPCLTVLCGNSEGEQQAAMWGASRDRWAHPLFERILPAQVTAWSSDIPYWPSSAHGGAFPHQGSSGTTSYYGVGAYRRPLTDARRAEIRFATECLAFANIPEAATLESLPGGPRIKVHQPEWKARTPRDLGAGWDFDDIRDHYFAEIFGVPPLDVRYADHDRYLQLSRVVSGEVMAAAFREWRRKRSTCHGALIWFLRDLWPGAGWGIIDARGVPKAPYYFLRRVLQPQAIFLSDEGGNGVFAHVANETARALQATVAITLYRLGEIATGPFRRALLVPARETLELPIVSLLDGFMDLNHAYRFGPPSCDLIVATLSTGAGEILSRDFYFPAGVSPLLEPDVGLQATAQRLPGGAMELTLQTRRLARYVTIQTDDFSAEDQYFHIAPHAQHRVQLHPTGAADSVKGQVHALNSAAVYKIAMAP